MSKKHFESSYPGHWNHINHEQWNDWRWQLRNRIHTLEQLEEYMELTPEEKAGVALSRSKLAMSITPQFFNLIDVEDPHCPIRRQVIPRIEETQYSQEEMPDPCGEDADMPVPGLVHRYPDRVLFLVTDRCASYCRYCTRSRVVSGAGENDLETDFEQAFRYIEEHEEVRDVLLSGGDPLLFNDAKLGKILSRLRSIEHVEFIRIGSRIPIFLPQRITPELCEMLKQNGPVWISVHTNHPKELTTEVREALGRLVDSGVPLGNQSVLLKGVNDNPEVMKDLIHKLLLCRVRPYYLYQCDLIQGSSHLRTSIHDGLDIMENLRGHTTGYAVPQYVVDGPGGGGKIPLNPDYIVAQTGDRFVLRNFNGDIFEYPKTDESPAKCSESTKTKKDCCESSSRDAS
ncbi:MAG: KamA family radical SAM protein [Verrucomicrobiota bacterium]